MASSVELEVRLPVRHAAQAQIVAEAERFNVLQCGRRFGKTTLGVDLDAETALDGLPAAWFAPTYKMLAEPWRAAVRALRDVASHISVQDKRIELITGGSVDFWSLDNPDAGRGFKYKRAVVDEYAIVRDLQEAWEGAIRPTLTDLQGDAWFLGSPKGRGYSHTLYVKGQTGAPGWKSWRFRTVDNPFMSPAEVEAARRDLPDAVFRQEYEGEPSEDGGNPFGIAAIRACVAPLSTAPADVYGVDLAKSVDWTVAIGLDASGAVCRFDRYQAPWDETERRIVATIGTTPALIDSTGVGDPIVERLQKGRNTVTGFKFSAPSKQQLMEGLAVAIQQRLVSFPDGPIVEELEAFQYEYTRTGVRYSAPEGLHDDCVMALALAVHHRTHLKPAPRAWVF